MKKNRKIQLLLFSLIILLGISISFPSKSLAQQNTFYVGPEVCKTCHTEEYEEWKDTGHANMLLTAEEAQAKGFPLPEGLSWDDIAYTIGGKWKIRYINKSGYIITWHFEDSEKVPGGNQWNIETQSWADYHSGEVKAYTCGNCHTTGYSPEGHQNDMPGIQGTWEFRGITCESCHGPGGEHITNPMENPMVIDVSAQVCGQCHVRGKDITYELGNPASFSYTHGEKPHKHHQQFYDWNMSAHSRSMETPKPRDFCLACHSADNLFNTDLITLLDIKYTIENATNPITCVNCHSPHTLGLRISHGAEAGAEADEITVCTQCHTGDGRPEETVKEEWHHPQAELYTGSVHYASGVTCVECHMPLDTKTAIAYDLRNHTMILESYGTYDYSCGQAIGCHKEQMEAYPNWAEERIEEIQTTVSTAIERVMSIIDSAEKAIATANETEGVDKAVIEEAMNLLLQAKSYSGFIETDGSLGFHNPTYALSALNTAIEYAAKAEATALNVKAQVLSGKVTDLGSQVTSLQNQITVLQTDIGNLEATISDLQSTVATAPYLYGGIGLAIGFIIGAAIVFAVRRGKS